MSLLPTRIADISVHVVQIPRHYVTHIAEGSPPGGKETSLYYVLQIISDDGQVGLGEISDIEPDWAPPSRDSIRQWLLDGLVGEALTDETSLKQRVEPAIAAIEHPELRRLTRCAVEMALLDLIGRCTGLPVCALLCGPLRQQIAVSWVAYIRSTEDVVAEVEQRQAQGFNAFKLKVGLDPSADDERVREVRQRLGPDAHLRVDASGAWDQDEAVGRLHRLAELGIDAVETPLSTISRSLAKDRPQVINEDPESPARSLAALRSQVSVPIIEHVGDFDDAFTLALLANKAVDAINVIPAQAGGLRRAMRLLQPAQVAGTPALLGSTVELGIGTAAALHVAAAAAAVTWASDLVGPGLLTADVVEPAIAYESGELALPAGAGLGVTLSASAMERWQA
jgi:muconate cycloisomerase